MISWTYRGNIFFSSSLIGQDDMDILLTLIAAHERTGVDVFATFDAYTLVLDPTSVRFMEIVIMEIVAACSRVKFHRNLNQPKAQHAIPN